MAANVTTYLVETKYTVDDRASKGLGGIAQNADRAAKSTFDLTGKIRGLMGAVAGGSAIYAGKRAFIDWNSSIEQSRISIAATSQLLQGGSWATAMAQATTLQSHYQQVAKKSVGETRDFVAMHQELEASALQAGLGVGKLTQMVEGATVASQVFGERAEVVALDVKQMLAGTVGARDRVANILLASQGIGADKFNKMKVGERSAVVMNALQSPALKNAARAMGDTWEGQLSTFKDNLSIALGKVGLPLFKAMTAELQRWNTWLDKNSVKVENMAKSLGHALVEGFKVVRDVGVFFAKNASTLIAIAKAWIGVKLIGGIGGFLGGKAGMLGGGLQGIGAAILARGGFDRVGLASAKLGASFLNTASALSKMVGPAAAAYAVAKFGAEKLDDYQNSQLDAADRMVPWQRAMERIDEKRFPGNYGGRGSQAGYDLSLRQGQLLELARQKGILRNNGQIDKDALIREGGGLGGAAVLGKYLSEALKHQTDIKWAEFDHKLTVLTSNAIVNGHRDGARAFAQTFIAAMPKSAQNFFDSMEQGWQDFFALTFHINPGGVAVKRDAVNVNIAKVEVAAKDPDRMMMEIANYAAKRVGAPSRARAARRRGR